MIWSPDLPRIFIPLPIWYKFAIMARWSPAEDFLSLMVSTFPFSWWSCFPILGCLLNFRPASTIYCFIFSDFHYLLSSSMRYFNTLFSHSYYRSPGLSLQSPLMIWSPCPASSEPGHLGDGLVPDDFPPPIKLGSLLRQDTGRLLKTFLLVLQVNHPLTQGLDVVIQVLEFTL